MVRIEVAIAARPHEDAGLQPALQSKHVRQQRVGSDVEWHAEEDVRTALVKLQVEAPRCDLRLKQAMTGRQRHALDLAGVPCGDDLTSGIRVAADELNEVLDLVDMAPVGRLPIPPLLAVDGAQIAA